MKALRSTLVVCAFAFGACANSAYAKIDVVEARYEAGVLVVRGNSNHANADVTLDRIYKERTGQSGEFLFRVRYRPRGCVTEIQLKDESVSARVASCAEPDDGRVRP